MHQKVITRNNTMPGRASIIRCCFSINLILIVATISLQSQSTLAFSSSANNIPKPYVSSQYSVVGSSATEYITRLSPTRMSMSRHNSEEDDQDINCGNNNEQRISGRKRAILRKYGKAIALSTTLLYGPMACIPTTRVRSTAHAASSTLTRSSDYNFKDFQNIKGKLSLAPGANAQVYEEVLAKVEVEGEKALKDIKKLNEDTAALTIGDSGEEGAASSEGDGSQEEVTGRRAKRAQRKIEKQKTKKQKQVSEWESDEFGFGEDYDDEDFDSGVLSFAGSTGAGKTSPSKSKSGGESGSGRSSGGSGDVVLTDKMAYNNYKPKMSKDEQTKVIKKGAFYSIFPVFVITMIRGQVKAWQERIFVKKGMAIKEEEYKTYLEEKKKKKEGKDDDDDDDDDGKLYCAYMYAIALFLF